jgi:hypothetical protein
MLCLPVEPSLTQRVPPAKIESRREPLVQFQCPIPPNKTAVEFAVLWHYHKDSMAVEPQLLCGCSRSWTEFAAPWNPVGNRDHTGGKASHSKGRHAHGFDRVA